MNIYTRKQRWKLLLFICAIIIAMGSYWFTKNLTDKLAREERKKVELWAEGIKQLVHNQDLNKDYSFILEVIRNNETVPVILTDEDLNVISSINLNKQEKENEEYYKKTIEEMRKEHDPIVVELPNGKKNYIFYKDSTLLTQLFYFPLIQLFVISLFLGISYYAFSISRKAEQNQVWVGMSKETAHQLGTPTSSLMANLELLKSKLKDQVIIQEIEKDIHRLKKITDRFSKIGSSTKLNNQNIVPVIHNTIQYLRTRSSKKVAYETNFAETDEIIVPINKPLLEWVLENVIKNAIDAMNGKGKISIGLQNKNSGLIIDIADTGKGIPKVKHSTIFQPGFTTKKRGWGLGLSLAKRIVEEYHKGKIYVHQSELKKGTTIRIILKHSGFLKS
ncbi:MAG: HAMP domain-containing sensor histidine kinase [Bacteroidales bacterium]